MEFPMANEKNPILSSEGLVTSINFDLQYSSPLKHLGSVSSFKKLPQSLRTAWLVAPKVLPMCLSILMYQCATWYSHFIAILIFSAPCWVAAVTSGQRLHRITWSPWRMPTWMVGWPVLKGANYFRRISNLKSCNNKIWKLQWMIQISSMMFAFSSTLIFQPIVPPTCRLPGGGGACGPFVVLGAALEAAAAAWVAILGVTWSETYQQPPVSIHLKQTELQQSSYWISITKIIFKVNKS